jgi:hypothetical protein
LAVLGLAVSGYLSYEPPHLLDDPLLREHGDDQLHQRDDQQLFIFPRNAGE